MAGNIATSSLGASPKYNNNSGAIRSFVKAFHFNPAKPCYCNSGYNFGSCCGANKDVAPKNLHIVHEFIPEKARNALIQSASAFAAKPLPVMSNKASGPGHKMTEHRVTEYLDLGLWRQSVHAWYRNACHGYLQKIAPLEWFEAPQLLRYKRGGRYNIHSDAEHFDSEKGHFYRQIDRDVSMLIYLNDDYSGGELNFPWLNYCYKPKAGDLVFFPSNHIFSHESLPVTHGTKLALVSWAAFKGTARVKTPKGRLRCDGRPLTCATTCD